MIRRIRTMGNDDMKIKIFKVVITLFLLGCLTSIFFPNSFASSSVNGSLLTNNRNTTSITAKVGQSVKLKAQGTGGNKRYYYRFSIVQGGKRKTLKSYSRTSTFYWKPSIPGTYALEVTITDSTWKKFVTKTVKVIVPQVGASLKTNAGSVVQPRTRVRVTASGSGGTGKYYYRFSIIQNGKRQVRTAYGSKNYYDWMPAAPGTFTLQAEVTDSTWKKVISKSVKEIVPELSTSFGINASSTVLQQKTVRMTAKASGGTGGYTYRFGITENGKWRALTGYTAKNYYDWKAVNPGGYTFTVDVMDSARKKVVTKSIKINVPALTAAFNINTSSTVLQQKTVRMTANAGGGSGGYTYRFSIIENEKWRVLTAYTSKNYFDWKALNPGSYTLSVDVTDSAKTKIITKSIKITVPELAAEMYINTPATVKQLTTIRLSSKAIGGTGAYFYRFGVIEKGVWKQLSPYGSKNTYDWKATSVGAFVLTADIADSTWKKVIRKTVTVTVPELTASLQSNVSNTIPLSSVQLTAQASGGTGIYYYRYTLLFGNIKQLLSDYATKSSYTWKPTSAGNVTIQMDMTDSLHQTVVTKTISIQVNPAQIKGVDVSKWQESVNWQKVYNAGYQFAMIKAGGNDDGLYQDRYFEQNYANAVANGLTVGIYYYGTAYTEDQAAAEAQHCLSLLKNRPVGLYVAYDVESQDQANAGKDRLTKAIIAFCETVKKGGYQPMVYANPNFYNNYIDISKLRALGYNIWVANYGVDVYNSIAFPAKVWQSTSTGCIDGIDGNVDIDTLYYYDPTMQVAECTGYSVNVRKAAGTDTQVVASISHGFIKVLGSQMAYSSDIGKQELWYNIQRNDGITGWISGRFIKLWQMKF